MSCSSGVANEVSHAIQYTSYGVRLRVEVAAAAWQIRARDATRHDARLHSMRARQECQSVIDANKLMQCTALHSCLHVHEYVARSLGLVT